MGTSSGRSSLVVCVSAILLLNASSSSAGEVTYTENIAVSLSSGPQTVYFPLWDPAAYPGQEFEYAKMFFDGTAAAHMTQENTEAQSVYLGLGVRTRATITFVTAKIDQSFTFASAENVLAGPSDGVLGAGPDFHDFGVLSVSKKVGGAYYDEHNFPGVGLAPATLKINQPELILADALAENSIITMSDYLLSGTLSVTYIFKSVPEPATVLSALIGFAPLAALALWRRSRARSL